MKTPAVTLLTSLLLVSCGKEEARPKAAAEPPKPATAAPARPAPEKKAPIVAPQGDLPRMDPEKAKFIAVPSTPKDDEIKKAEKPVPPPAAAAKE